MIDIFDKVLMLSLGAGVLSLLVLGARQIVGHRAGVFLPVLYALLIAKLIIPVSIESPVSIQNIWKTDTQAMIQTKALAVSEANIDAPAIAADDTGKAVTTQTYTQTNAAVADTSAYTTPQAVRQPSLIEIAAIIWLAGMAALAGCITLSNIRFVRMLRRNRAYTAPGFDVLLAECKSLVGIRKSVCVIQVSEIRTAAVYGILRPKLLISPHTFDGLSIEEKRHILLHELLHIKRRDTLVCLALTVLNIVHWFNPILWITFALIRKDLEVMCDAAVLKRIDDDEKQGYAMTLLYLARIPLVQTHRLATALFISQTSIKRRITMITRYKKKSALYSVFALLLTLIVAVTGCTTAAIDMPDSTVNEAEQTPIDIPDGQAEETTGQTILKLPVKYTLDTSGFSLDEATRYNIERAVQLLDGALIKPNGTQIELCKTFLPITEENEWKTAPAIRWNAIDWNTITEQDWELKTEIIAGSTAPQAGGGLEIVCMAVWKAAALADMDIIMGYSDPDDLSTGSVSLANHSDTAVIIWAGIEGSNIVIELNEAAAVGPGLMTSFTLDYSNHKSTNTIYNITKALALLDGAVISPGEEFSLNETLGPRNEATGWKTGVGISGGTFVEQYGGGVCAVSAALYNAAIRAELDIIERVPYSIMPDYVDPGLDATISTGTPDLVISNPYDIDVTINASIEDALITIEVYGPPMDYTVDFSSEFVSQGDEPETEYYYNTDTLPDGSPIPEGKSSLWVKPRASRTYNVNKTLYDVDGSVIAISSFETVTYREYKGIVYVNGPAPESTPPPMPIPSS